MNIPAQPLKKPRPYGWLLPVALTLTLGGPAVAQEDWENCVGKGLFSHQLGHPVDDYRKRSDPGVAHHLQLVENRHFYDSIEQLRDSEVRGGSVTGNIDYTLRRFPNHPRALYALSRYTRRFNYTPPSLGALNQAGFHPSIECYLWRAIRFAPDDPMMHMILAIHLHLSGHPQEALKAYKNSEKLFPNSPELQYNLGLLYYELKEYGLAKQYAQKAYKQGYPLPGLRDKLAKIDHWP